jgi:hypothetical protein
MQEVQVSRRVLLALPIVLAAATGAAANPLLGVYGPKGNDTGGIIPWSPEAEQAALDIAQNNCGWYNKFAVITTVHRVPGDYIAYVCRFDPPRRGRYHR